jgi:excisionase family DNA binding protein
MTEEQAPEPRWATIAEAATYSGIPESTMRRWVRKGTLPASRLGPRRIQVDLNEVDQLRRPVTTTTNEEPST